MRCFKKPIQAWRPTMAHRNQGSVASQVESLQRQFAQAPGLPFADVLPAELVTRLLHEQDTAFYDRIYTPLVTLAMFLSQCQDADPSQRQAVARLLAHRIAQKQPTCSSNTGAYAKARQRLPEKMLAELTRHTGQRLMNQAPAGWSWHGRHVKIVDGSTASLPCVSWWSFRSPWAPCSTPPSVRTRGKKRVSWRCSVVCTTASRTATSCSATAIFARFSISPSCSVAASTW